MAKHIETILAQLGNRSDEETGAVSAPLYLSTAYRHPGLAQSTGYDYIRTANPTRDILQTGIAEIEAGDAGFACSSGMAAIQLVIEGLLQAGDQVVTLQDLYGGSYRYFHARQQAGAYQFTYCLTEADLLERLTDDVAMVFIETPTNPMMVTFDIEKIAQKAHEHGIIVVVDNTFYTPLRQQPLALGADVVIHSATKYLSGHNDVLAGLVACRGEKIAEDLTFQLNTTGATLAPFDCWLVIRGMKTLSLRLKQHEQNARAIVDYLKGQDQVGQVYYAGHSGMVSFELKDLSKIEPFLANLKIFSFAESLGGVESLITYPKTQTHADIPQDLREAYGLTDHILRISTGIEHTDDLVADLAQAFDQLA
ncbi:cystathionine gamma-synthase [Aerococcus urinaehominis]|uniref:Cystathionine gamma-synthase n=1 Tax=Aerococcus urinaehominis TaxID=128944 RepID=A0A0X8FL68_9LACT|nr:aminotransferase class I/II-fold pyridoxal phosphate-dependent enzyme [Aerococcus urinaehominis]AMB99358.1 cystathionine gamma-synthase [Aerococcus urinaehominis]SDM22218.1 cystathionine gamma-synthase [Aerococcus urinaehominis]